MKSSGSTSMKQSTIFGLSQPAHESSLAAGMTKPQQKGRDRSMVWEFFAYYRSKTNSLSLLSNFLPSELKKIVTLHEKEVLLSVLRRSNL